MKKEEQQVEDLKNLAGDFIEVYRDWKKYGWGIMLCYVEPGKCIYVMHHQDNSFKKEVIDQSLFNYYLKGENT